MAPSPDSLLVEPPEPGGAARPLPCARQRINFLTAGPVRVVPRVPSAEHPCSGNRCVGSYFPLREGVFPMRWSFLSLIRRTPRVRTLPARRRAHRPTLEALEDRLAPATLPTGFTESFIASGLSSATAMEVAPDGKLFATEK